MNGWLILANDRSFVHTLDPLILGNVKYMNCLDN